MADVTAVFWGIDKPTWAILGAVAAVAVPMIYNMANEIIKARRERKYVLVQLIFLLDKYAAGCADVVWDDGYAHDEYRYPYLEAIVKVLPPTLDLSGVKGEHKYLAPKFLYKLQAIEIKQIGIEQQLRAADYNDPPGHIDYFILRRTLYAELGNYVAELMNDICTKLEISHHIWSGAGMPEDVIYSGLELIKQEKKERQEKIAARNAARANNANAE